MHPLSYRGCWHRVCRCFLLRYRQKFRPSEQEFTTGKVFILHAVSLRQAFAHCGRFLTAASRRSMDRVSVPFWLIILSDQLPVIDLVSRYLTNYLIGRRPLPDRKIFPLARASGITPAFAGLSLSPGGVPTCYAAVRRGSKPTRLACVRRTASVHSELGSNSSKMDMTVAFASVSLHKEMNPQIRDLLVADRFIFHGAIDHVNSKGIWGPCIWFLVTLVEGE